ncbi:MAG: DUF4070 domain-containing protein [Actinobacteria bacterium]|nr:DUF4070 domain-containing protein [Actinomycetota bacterium]
MVKNNDKNILLVYPRYTKTFWSFENILTILGKKASFPPLGLLTISSMLPASWNKKLVDTNVDNLTDSDINWADFVFISGMIVQKDSAVKIIERIKKSDKPVVAGGPLFTTGWEDLPEVEHLFLGEAETTLKDFINDVDAGTPKKVYSAAGYPDISRVPVPDWKLVNIFRYHSMCIQFSRGCPFNCEFCDVVVLNGRAPRTKSKEQIISELEALYSIGWRGGIFFVDDNLIGNKHKLKKEILPAIAEWQKQKRYPFSFNTQVSINISDDEELIKLMIDASFTTVFIGIETPDETSLEECHKYHNKNRDLVQSVKKLQNSGLEVQGGFIVGFDSDTPSIFQKQIEFIQKSGIVTAMVGLLSALPKTKLYKRLVENKRILTESSANNTLFSSLNFIPKMDTKTLFAGYKKILDTIYNPKEYYERIKTFLREFKPPKTRVKRVRIRAFHFRALFGSVWHLGIKGSGRRYFWRLLIWVAIKYPGLFPYAIGYSLAGIHFRSVSS